MRDPNAYDPDAPASSRLESVWFEPPQQRVRMPISHELEERRGWRPPSPSHGLVFAGVSFVLIGAAIAGSIFFLTPQLAPEPQVTHRPPPAELAPATSVSTTSADVRPSATAVVLGDIDAGAEPPRPKVQTVQTVQTAPPRPVRRHAIAPAPARAPRAAPAPSPTPTPTPGPTPTRSPDELFETPSGLDPSPSP